jgi:hypothetical protein
MSFLPFVRRWFGAKTAASQVQPAKPDPETELLDRAEVLLEDLNDFQDNVARTLDSVPGSFLTAGGNRSDANVDVLTGGGNADGLHQHASAAPVLSNTPPPAVAASSSAGTATEAARADHTHASLPVPELATQAPPGVAATSAVGSSARAAREDHTHASPPVPTLSNTAPPAVAASSSAGSSVEAARADHTHAAPAVRGAILMWGNSGWGTGTNTKYADPFWISSAAGTNPIQVRVPRPGTLRNLMFQARVGGAGTFTAQVRVNDVVTALAVTVGASVTQAENTVAAVPVNQGDRIDIEIVRPIAGSPIDITITVELD